MQYQGKKVKLLDNPILCIDKNGEFVRSVYRKEEYTIIIKDFPYATRNGKTGILYMSENSYYYDEASFILQSEDESYKEVFKYEQIQ